MGANGVRPEGCGRRSRRSGGRRGAPEARGLRDTKFVGGSVVLPVYMAKGLEFDAVVVCDASAGNHGHMALRRALYTACTRAMHELAVVYAGEPSPLLPIARPELYEE